MGFEIVVNANTIIGLAGIITALGVLLGLVKNTVNQINKWNSYDKNINSVKKEVKSLKNEQYMQTKVLLATLDGLHQLGCNGKVTEATNELNEFLNKSAHDDKEA